MAANHPPNVTYLNADRFKVTDGYCTVWKTKNIANVGELSSPVFTTRHVKFNFTWTRSRYPDKECYEIFLKCEDATSRHEFKGITVTTYLKDQYERRSSVQTVSRKEPENVMHFRVWHSELETLRAELCALKKPDHIVDVVSRIELKLVPRVDAGNQLVKQRYADPWVFLNALSEDSLKLFNSSFMTDVTLKCGEHEVNAHKSILSMRSKKFSDLVLNNEEIFNIDDMDFSTLQHVLRYIYSGQIPNVSNEELLTLKKVACQYQMVGLQKGCASLLILNLKPEALKEQLGLADKISDDWFKRQGSNYLKEMGYLFDRDYRLLTR